MAQAEDAQPGSPASNAGNGARPVRPIHRWATALAVIIVTLVATLLAFGPAMDFPTKVSERTSTDGSVTLDRTARDVTSEAIDDVVGWMTKDGAWLFDGISTVITYALVNIERALKWTPWPVIVVGLALLSFAVGRWRLLLFTSLALLFVGFMDLWENTMDTVALMIVAVAVAVSAGLPVGSPGRSQPDRRQPDASNPGWYADHAQLRLPASRHPLLRPWENRRAYSPPSSTLFLP